ncbi:prenyltransferase [Neptuniibacter sp.]|uniref:prenyltransferase n=1 Tax=Neptuniibacter sp. TaxID=1962643 RepID=UPI003B59CFE9
MLAEKYLFRQALRPFSFSVALVVCLTGILAANAVEQINLFIAVLILAAGLLLQAGVNLINDYSDLSFRAVETDAQSCKRIRQNFRFGLICLLVAAVIGLFLIYRSGWVLLLYAVIGILGALGYTLEPVNYKRRGLAVFLVFWLMGVLMVTGSYYILTLQLNYEIFLISVPVSIYTSLLLLSNEIRDYESDSDAGIKTLSVRIGYERAEKLYLILLAAVYVGALSVSFLTTLTHAWLVVFSLPVALLPIKYIPSAPEDRKPVTPLTGKSFLLFGVLYCLALVISI